MGSFIEELRRRDILRQLATYALVAWILIEAGSVLLPTFGVPEWFFRAYVVAIFAGLIVALVLSWIFEITPEGEKDFYYNRRIFPAEELKGWLSDPHVKIILWDNDEHIFHWNDVAIAKTYGINRKGVWGTEVQIAYVELGTQALAYAVGRARNRLE